MYQQIQAKPRPTRAQTALKLDKTGKPARRDKTAEATKSVKSFLASIFSLRIPVPGSQSVVGVSAKNS